MQPRGTSIPEVVPKGFTKWVDSGVAPTVYQIQTPEWDCFSERGADFMEGPFAPRDGGAICDLYLIPGDTTRIVVRVLHAAMDARGLQHFMKDIFRVLRAEEPIGSNSTLTDYDVRIKFKDKIQGKPAEMECVPVLKPSPLSSETLTYIWRRAIVNRNISNMLPKMAIFLAEHARKHDSGDVGFTIPVDLRGLREDVLNTTANMTGYLRVKVNQEATAKVVMQQINQGIKSYLDCIIPPIFKWVPWIPSVDVLPGYAHQHRQASVCEEQIVTQRRHCVDGNVQTGGLFVSAVSRDDLHRNSWLGWKTERGDHESH